MFGFLPTNFGSTTIDNVDKITSSSLSLVPGSFVNFIEIIISVFLAVYIVSLLWKFLAKQ